MKRFTIAAGLLAVCALAFAGAGSAGAGIEEFPVTFTLTSATCPLLPSGTIIEGSGTEKSITNVRTDRNGVTTVMNTSHAFGTATDQNGNSYVFNYSNSFSISNTGPTDPVFSGRMVDAFSLAGPGPAKLHNGFVAGFTTGPAGASFDEQVSHGDPIAFPSGESHCDPL